METTLHTDNIRILRSLLSEVGPAGDITAIRHWLKKRNEAVHVDIRLTDFAALSGWHFDSISGDLEHNSGKFFAIRGLAIHTDGCPVKKSYWTQPIIDQPEVGFLGIIAQERNGVLCFLMQAKIEPGNLNHVQLSPTLQATRSNYMQVHKGKVPRYLEYFKNANQHKILLDQLQSEQGARFFQKRNRNIIIEVTEPLPEHEDFIWVTLGQLKKLMQFDNLVNMDTRTVISGLGWQGENILPLLPYADSMRARAMLASLCRQDEDSEKSILYWLSELKTKYSLLARLIPLKDLEHWQVKSNEIVHDERLYFRVVGADITIANREVAKWCQPLVQPMQNGICALLMKVIDGVAYFLIQAKLECGTMDIVELAPTVQCLTGNYNAVKPLFLKYIESVPAEKIIYDCNQSEEGGRFYQEQNRNILVEAGEDFPDNNLPENYRWMTLWQLRALLKFNNYLNIQLRSLLAAINPLAL